MDRRDDDFIVDDEGFGYKDRGGEIWEVNESNGNNDAAKKKKRKLNVSLQNMIILPLFVAKRSFNNLYMIFVAIERWIGDHWLHVSHEQSLAKAHEGFTC